ncbi:MAG: SDR family NAD(P)-dependent oxidoreductase, partial [Candidatus Hydrogenedentes bacterium]|nr:SDR family NAD(P)-dependent oxidoreductase [Candidatus Hydrogenedentota bacterium]
MMCSGKRALVTGAAGGGMGRSIALTLAREGAQVVVNYRTSRDAAEGLVEHIASEGGDAVAVQADAMTKDGCRTLVQAARDRFGGIDICVVNPGGEWRPGSIDKIVPEDCIDDIRR